MLLVLQLHHILQLLGRDAIRVVYVALTVGKRDHFAAKLDHRLRRVLRHVAAAGNRYNLTLQAVTATLHHVLHEIHCAVSRGLRTNQRTAHAHWLACEHTRELVPHPLVLTKEEPDFATAHTDIACRNISVGADVTRQLRHEGLAEPHHLDITLASTHGTRNIKARSGSTMRSNNMALAYFGF